MDKDSFGNPLPTEVFLSPNCTAEQLSIALTMTSFKSAVELALKSGYTVKYNQRGKKATIYEKDGTCSYVSHM